MTKSTNKVEVVKIHLEPHPNADSLSIVRVFGYTVCVKTDCWAKEQLAGYIVPDTLVNTNRPEFSFLANEKLYNPPYYRVTVKKFRGIVSQGLLVPAPSFAKEGDDISQYLETIRYERPEDSSCGGDFESGPDFVSKYDIDSYYRYPNAFNLGEPVVISEKIDGSNARFMWAEDRIWVGSRSGWKKQEANSIWWVALEKTPQILDFCKSHPEWTLFGEVFGANSKMPYSVNKNQIRFAAFDIADANSLWLDVDKRLKLCDMYEITHAPILSFNSGFNPEMAISLSDGDSKIDGAPHLREGCVIEPMIPRFHEEIGNLKLKIVGNKYLGKVE